MLRRKLEVAVFGVLVVALALTGPALAKKQFFAIATGGTGGTYYPLGGVLAQAMSNKVADIIDVSFLCVGHHSGRHLSRCG
jgi:TRAP-type uncharacterized transport system substrate-binding protein